MPKRFEMETAYMDTWLKDIPEVAVKKSYVELEAPVKKRAGVDRACWPKQINSDCVDLQDFCKYLDEHMAKKKSSTTKCLSIASPIQNAERHLP